ncbi:MAG: hypothetical protein FWD63_02165 [Propionibacteriaceae bacterium]|nr:hypothetical protein [Propionibacteriaceae bacterium]
MATSDGWSGTPQVREILRDSIAGARAQIAATLTTALVLATVCFTILVTTGQSAATQAHIIGQIDSAGTRLIALSDNDGASGILSTAPEVISGLSDVSWAFGLGAAIDVTNPILPVGRAASRVLVGELPPELPIIQGRAPRPGEAVAGVGAATALNLGPGLGRIQTIGQADSDPIGVVGVFTATGPLAHLNDVVLIAQAPEDVGTLRYVYVMAVNVVIIDRLEHVLTTSTPATYPVAMTVETPVGAIAWRNAIAGGLSAASRELMALIMAVGAALIAITMFTATTSRRAEFGRRRALGATRSVLVASLIAQTAISATPGVVLGIVSGLGTLMIGTGMVPAWRFTAGVGGLVLLLALVASTPIAIIAAHRDPLRILRVP